MYSNDTYKAGQIIPFGRYMQKADSEYQPLEWIILDIQDGKALLLSKDGLITSGYCDLEYAQYNHRYLEWEYSRARAVLNREFYYYAFSKEDKTVICEKLAVSRTVIFVWKILRYPSFTPVCIIWAVRKAGGLFRTETAETVSL